MTYLSFGRVSLFISVLANLHCVCVSGLRFCFFEQHTTISVDFFSFTKQQFRTAKQQTNELNCMWNEATYTHMRFSSVSSLVLLLSSLWSLSSPYTVVVVVQNKNQNRVVIIIRKNSIHTTHMLWISLTHCVPIFETVPYCITLRCDACKMKTKTLDRLSQSTKQCVVHTGRQTYKDISYRLIQTHTQAISEHV